MEVHTSTYPEADNADHALTILEQESRLADCLVVELSGHLNGPQLSAAFPIVGQVRPHTLYV